MELKLGVPREDREKYVITNQQHFNLQILSNIRAVK
jgi:hypothetical protein